jgi:(p)ppGpp synthase/HD superfamily hydrolase
MSNIERAIAFATAAHAGQVDKAGAPYILHPIRVMLRVHTDEERIVAMLHDVVEDSPFTIEDLRRLGFADVVIDAVEALTKGPDEHGTDEGYFRFVERAARHPVARSVKLADLEDNMDLSRIAKVTAKDHERIQRYRRAVEIIRSVNPSAGGR